MPSFLNPALFAVVSSEDFIQDFLEQLTSSNSYKAKQAHMKRQSALLKELDLRRKLLFKYGKYELEDGEIFE
jgi:hypothetical protein